MRPRQPVQVLVLVIALVLVFVTPGSTRAESGLSLLRVTPGLGPVIPCPPPPIPPPPGCEPTGPAAHIGLRLSSDPGGAVAPAQIMTYQFVAHNSGPGDASDVRITLPFAADAQTPLDATFSNPSGWVSAVLTETVELLLGPLKRDQTLTATLRLRINPTARLGRDLATRAWFRWSARHDSGSGLSNRAPLVVARQAANQQGVLLVIEPPTGVPTTTFAITYDGFASSEHVSLWYQRPGGANVGLGELQADTQGRIAYRLAAVALTTGHYTVSAYGQYSRVSTVGAFEIADR